ncbi:hypothetical protein ACQ4PT_044462 [Festuca glaucescens]
MNIEKAAQEIFNNHYKSVVLVLRKFGDTVKGCGTGFIIGGKGTNFLVLTCQHFTRKKPKYEYFVRLPGEITEYKAKNLHECVDTDIAMFQFGNVTSEYPSLQFRDSYNLSCQTAIFLLGYVLKVDHDPNIKKGKVKPDHDPAAKRRRIDYHPAEGKTVVRLTLFPAVSPLITSTPHRQNGPGQIEDIVCTGAVKNGASGSPVMSGNEVVGMLFSCGIGTQACNVRPTETIKKVLNKWLRLP